MKCGVRVIKTKQKNIKRKNMPHSNSQQRRGKKGKKYMDISAELGART